jgi:hypothetical protein
VPYIDAQYFVPLGFIIVLCLGFYLNGDYIVNLFTDLTPATGETRLDAFSHKIPYLAFTLLAFVMTYLSVAKRLSLIPVLGVLSCAYLMSELGITNWLRFAVWMLVGLAIYFGYGYVHSHLRRGTGLSESSTASLKLAAIGFSLAAIGLSVSSFSFINDFILYLMPSLDKSILRTIELGLLFVGLALGIYGATAEVRGKKTAAGE